MFEREDSKRLTTALAGISLAAAFSFGFMARAAPKAVVIEHRGEDLGIIAGGRLTRFETPSAICFVYAGQNESLSCIPNR